ncbi:MAG: hypothetical protein JW816_04465 [Candidatus Buchananbacteria bacterium]|nr:hypothetical protein [Candidatus Buchananbacteria bacterium]
MPEGNKRPEFDRLGPNGERPIFFTKDGEPVYGSPRPENIDELVNKQVAAEGALAGKLTRSKIEEACLIVNDNEDKEDDLAEEEKKDKPEAA